VLETLSKIHNGIKYAIVMDTNEFIYKSQDVDYLGFLEAQLRDLHGIDTLAYELVQNADDVQDENGRSSSTAISFDVTDDALIVDNNGVFRPVDFARLQSIAGGDKRREADTTGAFGLGFIAVYQVTDAPEIFSNGRHWRIQPDAPPNQRIQERRLETSGTRFRLPWAFDAASRLRRTLRLAAIRPEQLDEFAASLGDAVKTAALFLRQLRILEVWRNGTLVQRIERQTDDQGRLSLRDQAGETAGWLLLSGDYAVKAKALRAEYEWQIETHRRSQVRLALPLEGPPRGSRATVGRLFAVLPTDSTTPLPFHINADFFPTTDRKRIHFDSGYQADWNQAAIRCAAGIIAHNLAALPAQLGPVNLWQLLQQMVEAERLAKAGELHAVFTAFWEAVTPLLPMTPLFYTAQGEWRLPADGRLVEGRMVDDTAVALLAALHIPVPHPDLTTYLAVMRRPEVGAVPLTIQDVADALVKMGLSHSRPLYEAPPSLRTPDAWHALWRLLDGLLNRLPRPEAKTAALDALNRCAIVLTNNMTLARPSQVYRGRAEAQALFPNVTWLHDTTPGDTFPGRYVTIFGARQAVDLLAEMPIDQLEEAWRLGQLDLPRLWRWFESQQIEILADDPTLPPAIRRLPLCPAAGELRPLADLYLPGNFDDPLKLAGLIDLEAMGGRPQFLRDLGVAELEFETYIHRELPRVLAQHPDLPSDARQRLLHLLAARLGEIRDDELLQSQLGELPLIPGMDGVFRAAQHVYTSREVIALLGEGAHVAEPAESQAVQALYAWLGVRAEPAVVDIAQALLALSRAWPAGPLDATARARVWHSWQKLNDLSAQLTAETAATLRQERVIPNHHFVLAQPDQLFWPDRPDVTAKFGELEDYLLPEMLWGPAVAAVGVRPFSQAVELQLIYPAIAGPVSTGQAVPGPALSARLSERRPLIDRLLQAEGGESLVAAGAAKLDNLRVLQTPHLQIQYHLPVGDTAITTVPETIAVKLDIKTKTLVISEEAGARPWAAIARELAFALKGADAVGTLALGLREVLAADSVAEAAQVLAELGL
jgi:hypothetical protein